MLICLDDLKLNTLKLHTIGRGCEGVSYKYNDLVLKVNYNKNSSFLTEKTALKLIKIETSRINLPINLIYNKKNKYVGYSKKFIEEKKHIRDISNEKLISELKLIKEDIINLSNNHILLNDCNNLSNIIYDGNINYIDPGSFVEVDYKPLFKNYDIINQSIYDLFFDTIFFDNGELKKVLKNYNVNFLKKSIFKKIISEIVYYDFKNNHFSYIEHLIKELEKTNDLNEYRIYLLKKVIENGTNSEFVNSNINKIKKLII